MVQVQTVDQVFNKPIPARSHTESELQPVGTGGVGISIESLFSDLPPLDHTPTISKDISPEEFLDTVTAGLSTSIEGLLKMGVLSEQDLADIDEGLYTRDQIDAFRLLVIQQLQLRS